MNMAIDLKDRRWHRIKASWPKKTSQVFWIGLAVTSYSQGEILVTVASKEMVMNRITIIEGSTMIVTFGSPTVLSRRQWPLKAQASRGHVSLSLAISAR
jgi:hypothetical protein